MKRYDTAEAEAYSATRTTWPEVAEFLLKYIHNDNYLDTGCGSGNDLRMIYQKTGFLGYGCDGSYAMLKLTAEKLPVVKLAQVDLDEKFPFDKLFNVIYMHDVIHHLKKPEFFIHEFYKHLEPNGVFLLGSEFTEGVATKYMNNYFPSARELDAKRYHSRKKITQILTANKFTVIEKQERTNTHDFTTEVLMQIQTRSHSILRLIPDEEFISGVKKIEEDYTSGKLKKVSNDYTLLAAKKI